MGSQPQRVGSPCHRCGSPTQTRSLYCDGCRLVRQMQRSYQREKAKRESENPQTHAVMVADERITERLDRGTTGAKKQPQYMWWEVVVYALADAEGWQCQLCGVDLTIESATIDHVHELHMGGWNRLGNLMLCCKPCNVQKSHIVGQRWRVGKFALRG